MPEKPWEERLNERERKEVALARVYVADFGHGTAGHLAYTTIARLADLLDEREVAEIVADLKDGQRL
jgi:hypothetical protein